MGGKDFFGGITGCRRIGKKENAEGKKNRLSFLAKRRGGARGGTIVPMR
jgi:hypothetical protein